jgi:hypothetical protein
MGLFWDLLQQSQLSEHRNRADTLERKVHYLEQDLSNVQTVLRNLIIRLEEKYGEDLDDNGIVG